MIQDIQLIVGETLPYTDKTVLNRAINKLQLILDNSDSIPEAERTLIIYITQDLKETLEEKM